MAVREGVCVAKFFGFDNWVVELDALNTISAIQNSVRGLQKQMSLKTLEILSWLLEVTRFAISPVMKIE